MKKYVIIDKNLFESEEIGHWLSESQDNILVVSDFAMMESFSGDAVKNFSNSFRILCNFQNQILKMKDNNSIRSVTANYDCKIGDLIDNVGTDELVYALSLLKNGGINSPETLKAIKLNGKIAEEKLSEIYLGVNKSREHIEAVAKLIRKGINGKDDEGMPILSRIGKQKVKNLAIEIACMMMNVKITGSAQSFADRHINLFDFRYSLAAISNMTVRSSMGSYLSISGEKARNDVVDCNYITCSTYLHGFKTNDKLTYLAYKFLLSEILETRTLD